MPNWCEISIEIYALEPKLPSIEWGIESLNFNLTNQDSLSAFSDMVETLQSTLNEEKVDLTTFWPMPDELTQVSAPFFPNTVTEREQKIIDRNIELWGHPDWYSWAHANWGTKWAPDLKILSQSKTNMTLYGQSAWCPPSELLRRITSIHPVAIIISFREDGMCFGGAEAFVRGELVYGDEFQYDEIHGLAWPDDDESWDEQWVSFNEKIDENVDAIFVEAFSVISDEIVLALPPFGELL